MLQWKIGNYSNETWVKLLWNLYFIKSSILIGIWFYVSRVTNVCNRWFWDLKILEKNLPTMRCEFLRRIIVRAFLPLLKLYFPVLPRENRQRKSFDTLKLFREERMIRIFWLKGRNDRIAMLPRFHWEYVSVGCSSHDFPFHWRSQGLPCLLPWK